jgi:hypothetical protein
MGAERRPQSADPGKIFQNSQIKAAGDAATS